MPRHRRASCSGWRHTEGEPPLGDSLPDDVLVQVGDQDLGGGDRCQKGFLGRALWGRDWLWNGLGDFFEGSGCAEAADAGWWIEAALEDSDVVIEAEGAARRLVGHGDTRAKAHQDHPRWAVEYPFRRCQVSFKEK